MAGGRVGVLASVQTDFGFENPIFTFGQTLLAPLIFEKTGVVFKNCALAKRALSTLIIILLLPDLRGFSLWDQEESQRILPGTKVYSISRLTASETFRPPSISVWTSFRL